LHTKPIAIKRKEIESKPAKKSFRDIEERFRALHNCISYCIYVHNFEGKLLDVNNTALNLLGYSEKEIFFLPVNSLFAEEQLPVVNEYIEQIKQNDFQKYPVEYALRKKNGDNVWVEAEASLISHESKPYAIQWIARDITSGKKKMEELQALSLIDDLSGLYNRRGFLTLAEQQLKLSYRTRKELLLFFVDVDNLKWINDTFGHHEGDKALIDTANILKQTFRESDIIARIGGDEFVVLTIDSSMANSGVLITRLQKNLKACSAKDSRSYQLSVSIGIAFYNPECICSVSDLLVSADKMMYKQKRDKLCRYNVFESQNQTDSNFLTKAVAV
jgi:diguanylate cyclase (GGDEF)-like protein/PAS domain S-box-containing protein